MNWGTIAHLCRAEGWKRRREERMFCMQYMIVLWGFPCHFPFGCKEAGGEKEKSASGCCGFGTDRQISNIRDYFLGCLLYTSDAADE